MWMNAKKKLALLLSLVLLLMLLPASVQAEETVAEVVVPPLYLALGDSISYGLTDLSGAGGYTQMFYDEMLMDLGYRHDDGDNLSYPGDTTLDLLGVIGKNHKMVKDAGVITISIGSNHLLGPAIDTLVGLFGINPEDYSDLDGEDMIHELAVRMQADWIDGDFITPETRFMSLMAPTPEAYALNQAWMEGSAMFARKWPLVISKIRRDNPDAIVIVNTVYNPLKLSLISKDEIAPLYNLLDSYVDQVNQVISDNQSEYHYGIVDVNTIVELDSAYDGYISSGGAAWYTAPVVFNIPAAIAMTSINGFDPNDPADFLPFFLSCDPHPTTFGHSQIALGAVTQYVGFMSP